MYDASELDPGVSVYYLIVTILLIFSLSGCAHEAQHSENLFVSLCGNTYVGAVVSKDPQDEDWRKEQLVLGPVRCPSAERVEMPLAVGENTSRTWIITGSGAEMDLRHQHLHDDGSPDNVSGYGGFATTAPKFIDMQWKVDFPADDITIKIFKANDLEVSITNIWTLEVQADELLAYELNRKERHFRAEFDLSKPLTKTRENI